MEDYIKYARQEREQLADFLAANPNIQTVVGATTIMDRGGNSTPRTIPDPVKKETNRESV